MIAGGRCGAGLGALACLLVVLLLILVPPASTVPALLDHQQPGGTPADATEVTGEGPNGRTIGIYITSLHDFDAADDSFGADYLLWSAAPPETAPLDNVEYVNAKQVDIRLIRTVPGKEERWSRQKIRAVVLHDWDLSKFPFDHQTLQIDLRLTDPGALAYRPDKVESGYGRNIAPNGWRVTGFEIEKHAVEYATTFGDPAASGGSKHDYFRIKLQVKRTNSTGFLKMIAGVYAALALGCLSFLMKPDQATVFSGRITLLAASLFAIVVNLQVSDALLGSLAKLGLVQKIHILAMVYVFIAALMAVVSRRNYDSDHSRRARRGDLIGLCVFSTSFVVLNAILILQAAVSG